MRDELSIYGFVRAVLSLLDNLLLEHMAIADSLLKV